MDISEEPVSHLQWETILVRKIKAGTLKKLVDNLVSEKDSLSEDMDPGYLMAFLSTYRAFADVQHVLELLIERSVYKMSSIKCVMSCLVKIGVYWQIQLM